MNQRNIVRTRDVMEERFIMLDGRMTVTEAIKALLAEDAGALMVKKRNEYDEYGIVMVSDIAKKVLARDCSPDRVNIYEIMSKPVLGVPPDMDVRYCSRLFDQFGLSCAPVIENDQVIGMVSYRELVLQGIVVEQAGR
jgi:predicted transcriptional regulator